MSRLSVRRLCDEAQGDVLVIEYPRAPVGAQITQSREEF